MTDELIPTDILTPDLPTDPEEVDAWIAAQAGASVVAGTFTDDDALPAPLRWVPADESQAEWAASRLTALAGELSDVHAQRAVYLERIETWYQDRIRQPKARADRLAAALMEYGRRWQAEDDRRRTLHLPSGVIKARVPQSGTVEVGHLPSILEWCRARDFGAAIKTTPDDVYISEIRKVVKAVQIVDEDTGEVEWQAQDGQGNVVPGLIVQPPEDPTFKVEV